MTVRRVILAAAVAVGLAPAARAHCPFCASQGQTLSAEVGQADPSLGAEPPLYAAACRATKKGDAWLLETWAHVLTLGQPLPTLPLWLDEDLSVPLNLEESYEETCRVLRIA